MRIKNCENLSEQEEHVFEYNDNEDEKDSVDENDEDMFDEHEYDEMQVWLAKEDAIRWILSLQVQQLCLDVNQLHQTGQPQLQHRRRQDAAVPRYLWGHQTVRWGPLDPSQIWTAKKTRRQYKLLNLISPY